MRVVAKGDQRDKDAAALDMAQIEKDYPDYTIEQKAECYTTLVASAGAGDQAAKAFLCALLKKDRIDPFTRQLSQSIIAILQAAAASQECPNLIKECWTAFRDGANQHEIMALQNLLEGNSCAYFATSALFASSVKGDDSASQEKVIFKWVKGNPDAEGQRHEVIFVYYISEEGELNLEIVPKRVFEQRYCMVTADKFEKQRPNVSAAAAEAEDDFSVFDPFEKYGSVELNPLAFSYGYDKETPVNKRISQCMLDLRFEPVGGASNGVVEAAAAAEGRGERQVTFSATASLVKFSLPQQVFDDVVFSALKNAASPSNQNVVFFDCDGTLTDEPGQRFLSRMAEEHDLNMYHADFHTHITSGEIKFKFNDVALQVLEQFVTKGWKVVVSSHNLRANIEAGLKKLDKYNEVYSKVLIYAYEDRAKKGGSPKYNAVKAQATSTGVNLFFDDDNGSRKAVENAAKAKGTEVTFMHCKTGEYLWGEVLNFLKLEIYRDDLLKEQAAENASHSMWRHDDIILKLSKKSTAVKSMMVEISQGTMSAEAVKAVKAETRADDWQIIIAGILSNRAADLFNEIAGKRELATVQAGSAIAEQGAAAAAVSDCT